MIEAVMDTKSRDISIDILKFFACLLITNSHFDILYGNYQIFATGGAIGNALFFFCSGYTIFLGEERSFFNYYKRRINRIYPTVFGWAIVLSLFLDVDMNMKTILLSGGGWFVSCIMIYYVFLFVTRKLMKSHVGYVVAVGIPILLTFVWYFGIDFYKGYNIYNGMHDEWYYRYFPWTFYYFFMLLGAIIGQERLVNRSYRWLDGVMWITSVVLFYAIQFFVTKNQEYRQFQILSVFVLLAVVWYSYKVCNSILLSRLFYNKNVGLIIKFISGLCLEVYVVQNLIIHRIDWSWCPFPLNIFICFFVIVAMAYIVKCVARIFAQTFSNGDYRLSEIIKLY